MLVAKKVFKEIKMVDNISLPIPAGYKKCISFKNLQNVHLIKNETQNYFHPETALVNERIDF